MPLNGLRVVDASRVLAGPYAGQLLGDLGADVVKIERPHLGDDTRHSGPPFVGDWSAYFLATNRNKRSPTLELQCEDARAILTELLDVADVLIENFRTDSLAGLGLTHAELQAHHPRLIVASISGFGRTGEKANTPGYDFAIQALSGLMSITGPADGEPSKVGVAITDVVTGLHATVAILAALRLREQTGRGSIIDLALMDCAIAAQVNLAQAYLVSGVVPARQGNAHLQIVPYQQFATADGHLIINVGNDTQWQAFCLACEQPEWLADERFATNRDRVIHRDMLIPCIDAVLRSRLSAHWLECLGRAGVPCALVQDYAQVFHDPAVRERGMVTMARDSSGQENPLVGSPFHFIGSEQPAPRHPPRLGEDSRQVLREWLHCTDAEIDRTHPPESI